MAGDVLNFDTLHGEVVTVAKTPPGETAAREFRLYDDIPAEVLLGAFGMQAIAARMQNAAKAQDSEAFEEAWTIYQEEIAALCGEIFRHTYPAMEDEEIGRIFTHSERERIVQLFFGRRSAQLRELLPDTTPGTGELPSETPAPAMAPAMAPRPASHRTRAERRAQARLRAERRA